MLLCRKRVLNKVKFRKVGFPTFFLVRAPGVETWLTNTRTYIPLADVCPNSSPYHRDWVTYYGDWVKRSDPTGRPSSRKIIDRLLVLPESISGTADWQTGWENSPHKPGVTVDNHKQQPGILTHTAWSHSTGRRVIFIALFYCSMGCTFSLTVRAKAQVSVIHTARRYTLHSVVPATLPGGLSGDYDLTLRLNDNFGRTKWHIDL